MRALGIILAGGNNERLLDLTHYRAVAAMPIAGCYRAIDFPLSNMSNSGIKKVAVITQYNSQSLIEHLSSSKWWDFGRKQGGLFVLSPHITSENSLWYRGTADAIYQNISFLKNSHEPYAIITSGDGIYRMNYNEVLEYHVSKRADMTIVCTEMDMEEAKNYGVIEMDDQNRIINFEEKPLEPQSRLASTGVYIIRRRLLIELLEEISKEGRFDIVNDIIIRYRKKKKIFAYVHQGYWKCIARLKGYYNANMDFLKKENRDYFFRTYPYIASKVADEPPAKFNFGAVVNNSLVGSGSIINGRVENSVTFRKVFVGEHSVVRNSLILDNAFIGKNCYIENCIVDSKSNLPDGSIYKGEKAEPRIVINKTPLYL